MTAIPVMQRSGCPVLFDATHSVQTPGGEKTRSGGDREMVPTLARAAVAAGADGVFIEVHPAPQKARSDASTQFPLAQLERLLSGLRDLRSVVLKF
jgi:2-dehydro-3-deoxyphosphooctonate aldolase (KDO 8-P synthase)